MALPIRLMAEPVRSLAFGSIGVAYMGVGTAFDHRARMIYISNLTNAKLMFSFDGVDDHFPIPIYSFIMLDSCYNKSDSELYDVAEGSRLYVKQLSATGAPSTGTVYVTVFYGKED